MLDGLRELSLEWYALLSQVAAPVSGPVGAVTAQWNIPALSALLFGLLGSLAPCQLTANVSATAYLSQRAGRGERSVWRDASAYLWGKVAVYTLLGAFAILLGLKLPTAAMVVLRQVFGPMMIVIGLHFLRIVSLQFSLGDRVSAWVQGRLPGRGGAGAFFLGAAYSFAFCPTMALLFFGLLVPLGIRTPGPAGLLLPALFALGTALPLLLLAALVAAGHGLARDWLHRVRGWDRYIRVVAGLVFLLAGLNDTILYWFL